MNMIKLTTETMKKGIYIMVGIIVFSFLVTISSLVFVLHKSQDQKLQGVVGAINTSITQANIKDNICNPNWSTSLIRPPLSYTRPIKQKLCAEQHCGKIYNYEL